MTKQTKKSKTSKKTTTHLKKAGILLLVTSLIFGLFYVGAQHIITSSPQNAPTPIPQINESTTLLWTKKKSRKARLRAVQKIEKGRQN